MKPLPSPFPREDSRTLPSDAHVTHDVTRDASDDYARRATMHRPSDADGLRIAALELAAGGLTASDIGAALGLSAAAVERLLQAGEVRPLCDAP